MIAHTEALNYIDRERDTKLRGVSSWMKGGRPGWEGVRASTRVPSFFPVSVVRPRARHLASRMWFSSDYPPNAASHRTDPRSVDGREKQGGLNVLYGSYVPTLHIPTRPRPGVGRRAVGVLRCGQGAKDQHVGMIERRRDETQRRAYYGLCVYTSSIMSE